MNDLTNAGWLLATWQLQVAIGSGYTAYMISYTGLRDHHKAIDTTFRTIAFGIVATAVMLTLPACAKVIVIMLAFAATVIAGVVWRRFGMRLWDRILRAANLSWADDTPSAWAKLSADQEHYVTQLSVITTDGVRLTCNDTRLCKDFPLGPCILGTNGDVLMYVTHTKRPDQAEAENLSMNDAEYGARMTYLPASSIQRLLVRRIAIPRTGLIERLKPRR